MYDFRVPKEYSKYIDVCASITEISLLDMAEGGLVSQGMDI